VRAYNKQASAQGMCSTALSAAFFLRAAAALEESNLKLALSRRLQAIRLQ
jgi:hypothetical protein